MGCTQVYWDTGPLRSAADLKHATNRACTNSHLLVHLQALYILMVFHYILVFPGLAEYFGIKYPFQHWLTSKQHAIPDEPSLHFRSLMKDNEELP